MERIKFFLWWCAGADLTTLKLTPTDHTRFTALGMMMMIVPCLACVSGTFFLTETLHLSPFAAAAGGCAWACIVFVLDRLILTFHRKGRHEFLRAVPRLVLSVSLALLIGEPLLVKLFQAEINLELKQKGQTVVTDARGKAEARFQTERKTLLDANGDLQKRIDDLKQLRDEKEAAVINEIEGTVGSGIKGEGPAARQKQQAFTEAKAAYEQTREELTPQITQNKRRLGELQTAIDDEVKIITESQSVSGGLMASHQALFSIVKREPGAAMTYVPLFFIMLLIEVSPLVSKLSFPASEYDKQLTLREKDAICEARRLAALEREKRKRQSRLLNRMARRVEEVVTEKRNDNVGEQEREVADLLRFTILDQLRREILAQQPQPNGSRKFGPEMTIEIVGRPDLRVSLQLPSEGRSAITLTEIDRDLQHIGDEIADDSAQTMALVKATSSRGREVHRDLPLLPQLEADQTMRLTFAPNGRQDAELPLA